MIQLLPVGRDVLVMFCMQLITLERSMHFSESQFWTSTQLIKCENRDVMEGIVFMKTKYKEAGDAFTIGGIQNDGLPRKSQMSVLSSG
jgi:hypothetical protein